MPIIRLAHAGMIIFALDLGLRTGLCVLQPNAPPHLSDVPSEGLEPWLRSKLGVFGTPDHVVAEQPLTHWRSGLSRELAAVIATCIHVFPQAVLIQAPDWKWQEQRLRRAAAKRYPDVWHQRLSPHERDAFCVALWAEKKYGKL